MATALAATFVGSAATTIPGTLVTSAGLASLAPVTVTAATTGLLGSGGVFSLAAGSLSAFDIFSGVTTAFSAISSIAAGQATQAASEEGALFEEFGAKQEILKGRREALDILEKENEALEQNIVNVAASGITGQGSAKTAQEAIISKAEFETGITRTTAELNAEARRAKAKQQRAEGQAAATGGVTSAAGDVAGFFLRRSRRG